jgi:hypothetical protein
MKRSLILFFSLFCTAVVSLGYLPDAYSANPKDIIGSYLCKELNSTIILNGDGTGKHIIPNNTHEFKWRVSTNKVNFIVNNRTIDSYRIDGNKLHSTTSEFEYIKTSSPTSSLSNTKVQIIEGNVIEVAHPRAGTIVKLRSNGKVYLFSLGAIDTRITDERVKAWNNVLKRLKPGDPIIIEYDEPLRDYGEIHGGALKARPGRTR